VATSCKEDFDLPPESKLKASLYNSGTGTETEMVVSLNPVGLDSLFYNKQKVKSFIVPLSTGTSTTFAVSLDGVYDTITFVHQPAIQYISMESGFFFEYKLESVSSSNHRIASIQITDSLVTNILHENIKIYALPLPSGSN
jgi:hypothetical protein